MSQTDLAELIGKTQQSISHMERDRNKISIQDLVTLSDYFGVTTDYILGIERTDRGVDADDGGRPEAAPAGTGESMGILDRLILTTLLDSLMMIWRTIPPYGRAADGKDRDGDGPHRAE